MSTTFIPYCLLAKLFRVASQLTVIFKPNNITGLIANSKSSKKKVNVLRIKTDIVDAIVRCI